MGSTLVQLRAALRQELRDENAAAYVWTDAVLDRHLLDALAQLQQRAPVIGRLELVVPAGNPARWSPAYPATYLWTEALEHPIDERPQKFVAFREEGLQAAPSICPLGAEAIASGSTVRLWYAHRYTLTAGGGDQPVQMEPSIVIGATYLALRDQAVAAVPKLVGRETVVGYREMAGRLAKEWEGELRRWRARGGGLMWRVEWG